MVYRRYPYPQQNRLRKPLSVPLYEVLWLSDWAKRIEITVDNTNIDSDLTQFPVPIVLGTSVGQDSDDLSAIFDELTSDANRFKIAITKSDGTTQIYGDIEVWDDANEKAVIHVAKSDLDITSASTTTLYIYYDSTQSDNTTYISDASGHNLPLTTSVTAKSVILDIADSWGDANYLGLRSVDFWYNSSKLTLTGSDLTGYSTTQLNSTRQAEYAFDTSLSKTGTATDTSWLTSYNDITNQRLICVFDTPQTFDSIVINNAHASSIGGVETDRGVQNVKILISDSAITSTVYNERISDSELIYDGTFDQHTASDVADPQTLSLTAHTKPSTNVWDDDFVGVYHMSQDPSGDAPQLLDSTSNNINGTSSGTMTSGDLVDGEIGKAIEFDGINDRFEFPANLFDSIYTAGVATLEVQTAVASTADPPVMALTITGSYFIGIQSSSDGSLGSAKATFTGSSATSQKGSVDRRDDTFHNLVLRHDGTKQALFEEGSLTNETTRTMSDITGSSYSPCIGMLYNNTFHLEGKIAEVRISKTDRSADWIEATHYALTDDLLTYGAEEEYSGAAAVDEITLDSGTLAFTGTDVDLIPDRNIILGSGTLAFTGTDITLSKSKSTITLDSGTLGLTGTDIGLTKLGSEIVLDSGTLTLSGTDITLTRSGRNIILGSGSLGLTGTDITLTKTSRSITLDSGTLALTGTDITLSAAGKIVLDSGTLNFTGTDITLGANRVVDLDSGTLSFNGSYIDLQLTAHGTLDGELPEILCECDLIERSGLLDSEFPQLSVEANTGIRFSDDLPSITVEAFGTGGEAGSVSADLPELKVEIRTSHGVLAENFPEILAEAVVTTPVLCDLSRSLPWISSEGLMAGSIGSLDKILGVLEIAASALAENTGDLNSPLPGLKGRITALAGSTGAVSAVLPELQSEAASYSVIISLSSYLPVITPGVVSGGSSGLTDNTMTNEDRFDDTLLRYQRWA